MNVNIDNIDWSTINNLYYKDMPLSSLYKGSNLLWNREVYGWHVDPAISDPANAITYLKDAVGMTPAAMGSTTFNYGSWANAFFMPKPCMLKYDGTVAYYLDPNDYTKKAGIQNLAESIIPDANILATGGQIFNPPDTDQYELVVAPVQSGKTYTFNVSTDETAVVFAFYTTYPIVGSTAYDNQRYVISGVHKHTFTSPIDGYIAFRDKTATAVELIVDGETSGISDISDTTFAGNAMMEWPLIWYKFEPGTVDGEGYFYCSNLPIDSSYKCWCNYDAGNNVIDNFYTSIYNTTYSSNVLRSLSGITLNGSFSTTVTQEVNAAIANNTTATTEWYTDVWSDRILINALLVLLAKSLDTQSTYGKGLVGTGLSINSYTTGALNTKGLFWGDTTNENAFVKVFGMENWWGTSYRRPAGFVVNDDTTKFKLTYGTIDGSTTTGYNTTGSGYITGNTLPNGADVYSELQTLVFNSNYGYSGNSVIINSNFDTYYTDTFRTVPEITPVQGGWTGGNGDVVSRYGSESEFYNIRICCPDTIWLDQGSSRYITISSSNPNIMIAIKYVDADNRQTSDTGWQSLPYTITATQSNGVRICFTLRKSDNSNITPSDAGDVRIALVDAIYPLVGGAAGHQYRSGAFSVMLTTAASLGFVTNPGLSCKPLKSN